MADPMLTGAIITFQTNDDDKDDDTILGVTVYLRDGKTVVAQTNPGQAFAKFGNDSEMGPFALWVSNSVSREQLKTGHVTIGITPNGYDTWRFNFVLDLIFSDGGHLLARATGIELTQDSGPQSFGIE
jgi:hypothetical protein